MSTKILLLPCRKMGRTIQFESHRNELAAILEYEHSKAVLEFWDQPPAIQLAYLSKHGRRLGVCHTPDEDVSKLWIPSQRERPNS
jgi:putative transposase